MYLNSLKPFQPIIFTGNLDLMRNYWFFVAKIKEEALKIIHLQFWAPVEIGGRQLLSTSGQPFAVNETSNRILKYRQRSIEYKYDIDVNYKQDGEKNEHSNLMIITGGPPATAFINRLPHKVDISKDTRGTLTRYVFESQLVNSIMLPICCPSQSSSSCIGVIEYSTGIYHEYRAVDDLDRINGALKEAGLSILDVQEHIPYKTLHGLKPARDQIRDAIEIVCQSEKLIFAQVWIAYYEDENQVPVLSHFEYARKKQMLALKMTGYCKSYYSYNKYVGYYNLCVMVPLDTGESLVEKTLQDYESRFYKMYDRLNKNQTIGVYSETTKANGIIIWLRSIDTGDFGYAFEFFWNSDNDISLEDLLLTLKRHLPSFKFASGAELGDELHVIDVENSTESDIKRFKIFEGKGESSILEALEEGKKPAVVEDKESLKAKHKTAPIELPQAKIEERFGKTQKDAAKDLKVSLSTLKRKCKEYSIYEWPGPLKPGKRKVNNSCNKSDTNEEDCGAILVPSASERNEKTLTIKAEFADDMIKFDILISEATFVFIQREIGNRFELTPGTYKLKYRDEDNDWILLTSEQDMNTCIRSSTKLDRTVIRLRVIPSA